MSFAAARHPKAQHAELAEPEAQGALKPKGRRLQGAVASRTSKVLSPGLC